jgi:predicted lipoprotein with Yx(FWY)xxD motif
LDETVTKGLEQQTGTDALIQATVGTKVHDKRGEYLTDGFGRALYLFKKDQQGSGGTQAGSKCYDACAKFWPPLLTAEEPKAEGSAKPNLLGTIGREDGGKQVTYNGWPLYRYAKDVGPQVATGHDISEFGAEWYLVSPSGRELNETHTSDEG